MVFSLFISLFFVYQTSEKTGDKWNTRAGRIKILLNWISTEENSPPAETPLDVNDSLTLQKQYRTEYFTQWRNYILWVTLIRKSTCYITLDRLILHWACAVDLQDIWYMSYLQEQGPLFVPLGRTKVSLLNILYYKCWEWRQEKKGFLVHVIWFKH